MIEDPMWQLPVLAMAIALCVIAQVDFKTVKFYFVGIAWLCAITVLVYAFFGPPWEHRSHNMAGSQSIRKIFYMEQP
jgi:RsiW-degrading membrane proteinase PrsW (M82 family)